MAAGTLEDEARHHHEDVGNLEGAAVRAAKQVRPVRRRHKAQEIGGDATQTVHRKTLATITGNGAKLLGGAPARKPAHGKSTPPPLKTNENPRLIICLLTLMKI